LLLLDGLSFLSSVYDALESLFVYSLEDLVVSISVLLRNRVVKHLLFVDSIFLVGGLGNDNGLQQFSVIFGLVDPSSSHLLSL
jgi:hypothetical protein